MPHKEIDATADALLVDAMVLIGVASSKSEARRLVEGGGVKVGDVKADSVAAKLSDFGVEKEFVIHKGKKVHIRVTLK